MTKDWVAWHDAYEAPGSSLARRLVVVQRYLCRALDDADGAVGERGAESSRRLLSLCAGEGRDVLPVLASRPGGREVRAVLVEFDPELSRRARLAAAALDLPRVEVRTADAGDPAAYRDAAPVDVLLACGVFGNIGSDDMRRTVAALPSFLAPGGVVIWTRGRGEGTEDPSHAVREAFEVAGFEEQAFTAPPDARFRVGVSRLTAPARPATADRLFTFR